MIAKHFDFATIVKSHDQRTPLWALMLATVWLNIIFVPLLLAHMKTFKPIPSMHVKYDTNIIHANYTHSLLETLILSTILKAAFL